MKGEYEGVERTVEHVALKVQERGRLPVLPTGAALVVFGVALHAKRSAPHCTPLASAWWRRRRRLYCEHAGMHAGHVLDV